MATYEDLINHFGGKEEIKNHRFSPAGKAYPVSIGPVSGIYWCYEHEDFIVGIHDFFIEDEYFIETSVNINRHMEITSEYIISGSGEWFHPYKTISCNSVCTFTFDNSPLSYAFHAREPFLAVEICFRKCFLIANFNNFEDYNKDLIKNMFYVTEEKVTEQIKDISYQILNCKMESPAADIFFEAKAKEWFSIILNAYNQKQPDKPIPDVDNEALLNVEEYIKDHYALTIPQSHLEKIAMMSGTKLKKLFKQKFNMTITEYTQRYRIGIAETLLFNSELSIGDIAKAVGYSSQSRFTQLFKRYKGKYPKDIKKKHR